MLLTSTNRALDGHATPTRTTRYTTTLTDLGDAETQTTKDPVWVTTALDGDSKAAEWLRTVPSEEPIPEEPALVCLSVEDIPERRRESYPIRLPDRGYVIRQLDPNPDLDPVFTEDEEPVDELKPEIPTSVGGLVVDVPETTVIEVWLTLNGNSITLRARDDQGDQIRQFVVDEADGIEQRVRIDTGQDIIASLGIRPSFEQGAETQYITEICVPE